MATGLNLEVLEGMGFDVPASSPNDMVVALRLDDDAARVLVNGVASTVVVPGKVQEGATSHELTVRLLGDFVGSSVTATASVASSPATTPVTVVGTGVLGSPLIGPWGRSPSGRWSCGLFGTASVLGSGPIWPPGPTPPARSCSASDGVFSDRPRATPGGRAASASCSLFMSNLHPMGTRR
jgi:hypothetical protein